MKKLMWFVFFSLILMFDLTAMEQTIIKQNPLEAWRLASEGISQELQVLLNQKCDISKLIEFSRKLTNDEKLINSYQEALLADEVKTTLVWKSLRQQFKKGAIQIFTQDHEQFKKIFNNQLDFLNSGAFFKYKDAAGFFARIETPTTMLEELIKNSDIERNFLRYSSVLYDMGLQLRKALPQNQVAQEFLKVCYLIVNPNTSLFWKIGLERFLDGMGARKEKEILYPNDYSFLNEVYPQNRFISLLINEGISPKMGLPEQVEKELQFRLSSSQVYDVLPKQYSALQIGGILNGIYLAFASENHRIINFLLHSGSCYNEWTPEQQLQFAEKILLQEAERQFTNNKNAAFIQRSYHSYFSNLILRHENLLSVLGDHLDLMERFVRLGLSLNTENEDSNPYVIYQSLIKKVKEQPINVQKVSMANGHLVPDLKGEHSVNQKLISAVITGTTFEKQPEFENLQQLCEQTLNLKEIASLVPEILGDDPTQMGQKLSNVFYSSQGPSLEKNKFRYLMQFVFNGKIPPLHVARFLQNLQTCTGGREQAINVTYQELINLGIIDPFYKSNFEQVLPKNIIENMPVSSNTLDKLEQSKTLDLEGLCMLIHELSEPQISAYSLWMRSFCNEGIGDPPHTETYATNLMHSVFPRSMRFDEHAGCASLKIRQSDPQKVFDAYFPEYLKTTQQLVTNWCNDKLQQHFQTSYGVISAVFSTKENLFKLRLLKAEAALQQLDNTVIYFTFDPENPIFPENTKNIGERYTITPEGVLRFLEKIEFLIK